MTLPRSCVAFCILLLMAFCGPALSAQESHWNDLNTQVIVLVKEGKYAEAIPVAFEAVKVAEATFGPEDSKVVISLNILSLLYGHEGRLSDVEPLYQRILSIHEKALGPENPMVAKDLNNLAILYFQQKRYADAQPLMERVLHIDEETLGHDNPGLVTDLNNLAMVYMYQDKNAEAETLFRWTLPIYEKTLGPDNLELTQTLNNLAHIYDEEGKYADAEPLYLRALSIREKALGLDSPDVATILNNLAALYDHQDRYKEAEPLYQRSMHIYEKALGPDDPKVATDLNNLASLYDQQGRFAEAEPLYQRALKIDEKTLGLDDPGVATDLNNLATHYFQQGLYTKAETLYLRVLQIEEKALGPDNRNIASALNNLAGVYVRQAKYADAEPLYQRALHIYEKAIGTDSREVATALNNLAGLYKDQGKYSDAESLYQHALQIREKVLGAEATDVAISLNNLAALNVVQGKYSDAESHYIRALHIFEKTLGPDHTDTASTLSNLAQLYFNQGRFHDAEPLYQRALRIDEKAFGTEHPSVATALNNLAMFYDHEGKYTDAETLYQRALRIHEKMLGPEHPEVATDLNNLALLYDHQGRYAEAKPLYQRAFDNIFLQFQYNFTYMSEKERLGFLDTVANNSPLYFSFVHRFRDKDPQLTGSMYNLLLWEKSFIAGSVADMRRAVEASGDADALGLLGQLTTMRTQIAAQLNVVPPDRALWRKQIEQLETKANEIEKALVARSSALTENKKLERATWQQVRDALQPGEAAVEFAHFEFYDKKWTGTSYYAALVVTHETQDQPLYIFLGDDKQIEGDATTRFQRTVQMRGLSTEPEAKLPGADAWELICKPLETALAGKTRIYLSPDGVLNRLPLGIIPAPDGKLMMERYDLRLLSSTKDILRAAPPRSNTTALLVGDPVFDLSEEQQRAATQKLAFPQQHSPVLMAALPPDAPLSNLVSRDQGNDSTLPRLPGTGAEVNSIAVLMQKRQWKTNVYTDALALKRVVEQASSPRVMHLATHGFFLPDQRINTQQGEIGRMGQGERQPSVLEDPMLRSGLYFAGANRTLAGNHATQDLDNGVLTAMEAGNLNLRGTELVVLSACNTGQGDVKNGEGVFGLRRALQEAGAQFVLMSLWSVPDKETLELMQSFYSKWLAGMEIHQALKEAQLEMRAQVRKSHGGKDMPYYWGAFVIVGR